MVSTNPLLKDARGALGKIVVFKQMNGKTVMTDFPKKANIPWEKQSVEQRQTRLNFRDASAYAKRMMQDPERKRYYEKKKKPLGVNSAYQAALTDYMRGMTLESVNMKKYTGDVGGQVTAIIRKTDLEVSDVTFRLLSSRTGDVIESGPGQKDAHGAWVYYNTVVSAGKDDVVVEVRARDCRSRWTLLEIQDSVPKAFGVKIQN